MTNAFSSHSPAAPIGFAGAESSVPLGERIAAASLKASQPATEGYVDAEALDVEAWNFVGDPLTETLVRELRDRKLMGGDVLANARKLEETGNIAAVRFFEDIYFTPKWVDFDAMRSGSEMAKRNPIGILMGMHGSLPFTYVDPATAKIMNSTGRLSGAGQDFQRRYWETASGFLGALDVDGMRPGGAQWEKWVRIRLLHTTIRLGILRSGRWDLTSSTPISQAATGVGAHIFGRYRVNIIRAFGGKVTTDEADSFDLMWRWITRILGAHTELLGCTAAEQFELSRRIGAYLYDPTAEARELTAAMIAGLNNMPIFPMSKRGHDAVARRVLHTRYSETFPGHDLGRDLGLAPDRLGDRTLTAICTTLRLATHAIDNRFTRSHLASAGMRVMTSSLSRGLEAKPAEYRATLVRGDRG